MSNVQCFYSNHPQSEEYLLLPVFTQAFRYLHSLKYNPEVSIGLLAAIHDRNEKYIVAPDKYFSETNGVCTLHENKRQALL